MKVPNIRFNLKFYAPDGGDIVIRTLADLEANLNLSDLCDYFKAGDLARWLRSIGEAAKADSLVELNQESDCVGSTFGEVCRVLQLTVPEQEIAAFVAMEERRKSRVEQSKLSEEGPAREETYIELVRGLIKNKLDILQTHKMMVKMLRFHQDSVVRDIANNIFTGLPCVNLLWEVRDDAWKLICQNGSDHLCARDEFGHRFSYWASGSGCGEYEVTDDGTGCLNPMFEVVEEGHYHGRHVFCRARNRGVVLKQKVIERLQEQDVMHDFVFTHN